MPHPWRSLSGEIAFVLCELVVTEMSSATDDHYFGGAGSLVDKPDAERQRKKSADRADILPTEDTH